MAKTVNYNITELLESIETLRGKLLEVMDLWHYYQTDVYQQIMFHYDKIFGDLEDEIDAKNQTAGELERKLDLLRIKTRKGENVSNATMRFVNTIIEREQKRHSSLGNKQNTKPFQAKKDAKADNDKKAKQLQELRCEVNDNYEIPVLYRNLVKKLHPDVTANEDYFKRYWNNVQTAYRSKDLDSLRMLHLSLCDVDELVKVDNRNVEISLKTTIFELEQSIKKQELKIKNLKYQEPFNLEDKLKDKHWIANRKNQLRERLFQIDRRIQHHNKLIETLVPVGTNYFAESKAV